MSGTLFIVSTPIGNPNDLTLRARRILGEVDVIICEERRSALALLAHWHIDKPLVELNEHTAREALPEAMKCLARGDTLALISDHGTPLVQDPGAELVQAAIRAGIRVVPIPGASAVLAGLVASGIPAPRFRFLGQLPAKTEARRRALHALRRVREPLVLLDAPYRLLPLLRALHDELGAERRAAVGCNLTMPDEQFVRGSLAQVLAHFTQAPFKGEFVVVVEGNREKNARSSQNSWAYTLLNEESHP